MPQAENISLIIDSICKKHRIEYNSSNSHYISIKEDACKLAKMYLKLKEMMGLLQEIEERHDLNGLKAKIEIVIAELNDADHLIFKIARELSETTND